MENRIEQNPVEAFKTLAKELDEYLTVPNPQRTHIHGQIERMKGLGMKILPTVQKKMNEQIVYSLLFQKIVYLNTPDEIEVELQIPEDDFSDLEPLRVECNKWWVANKHNYF